MKRADVNRCPDRARKRAASDLRCAARKLGGPEALAVLLDLFPALELPDDGNVDGPYPDRHAGCGS